MKEGTIVKFKVCLADENPDTRYQILEMRGDRALIVALVNMNIQPTQVVMLEDIINSNI